MALEKSDTIKKPVWENIPNKMTDYDRWICWKAIPDKKNPEKLTKKPVGLKGQPLANWQSRKLFSFEQVKEAVENGVATGVGFSPKGTPFQCVDLDNEKGIEFISEELRNIANASYTEISPSGRGLHVWMIGDPPKDIGRKRKTANGEEIEFFTSSGWVTVTGDRYNELEPVKNQKMIDLIIERYGFKNEKSKSQVIDYEPNNLSESEIMRIMNRSKVGKKIAQLMRGDLTAYNDDWSAAEMALMNYLAFFTQKDTTTMDSIYRQSGLYREKWDEKHRSDGATYGQMTIEKAIAKTKDVYKPAGQRDSVEVDFGDLSDGDCEGEYSAKLQPIHIGIELTEIKKQMNGIGNLNQQAELMKSATANLNARTPAWFWIIPDIKESSGKVTKVGYKHGYDHVKMGDTLIDHYRLVRYPKLLEGAVYDTKRGFWRYFGKNEMRSFIENKTLKELQKWGYYDNRHIIPTRIYVIQKTYDGNYPNATPFENSKPELVVFKNGTYNILTDTMREHDPNDYIMNAYNYALDISGSDTPHTDSLLEGLVGESSIFLKQFIGYTFYRSHKPAQEMVFFKGNGGEGKSTFLGYLETFIFGSDNVSAVTPQDLTKDKFQVVELLGKSANISADILDDYIDDSSILKRLTGGDPLMGQYKGIQGFKMLSYAKLFFSANKLPRFKDLTEGFSDRLAVVPFINGNQRVEGADFWQKHDMKKVEAESAAFAYACIREFKKIFDGKKAHFTKPESMQRAAGNWIFENDHIGEFLLDATIFHSGDPRGARASTVHKEYRAFCKENGYYPKTANAIKEYLESKGIPKVRSRNGFNGDNSNQRRYIGLELIVSYDGAMDFDEMFQ